MLTRVTISDIARKLNVSHTTVSRVLSGANRSSISDATRGRVFETARSMGYRPNLMARALATGRTNTIALWNTRVFTPYISNILYHVHREVKRDGFLLCIWDMEPYGQETPLGEQEFLHAPPADGVIAVELPYVVADYHREPISNRLPIVSMGALRPTTGDYVRIDLSVGAQEAMQHLIDIGCHRIAFLEPEENLSSEEPRNVTYHEAMRTAGLRPEIIAAKNNFRSDAVVAVTEYVGAHGYPDGMFCYNDELAIGANRALREVGLVVPDDVALVGCDGIQETEYHYPPLSTIALPLEEMARTAWGFLKSRIDNPVAEEYQAELKSHLVIRASSTKNHSRS